MTTESAGLWLIGLGALMVAVVGLAGNGVRLGLAFEGSEDGRADRLKFAISEAGLLTTAVGSVLIAISSSATAQFVLLTLLLTVVVIYMLVAWRVRMLWRAHRSTAAGDLRDNQDSKREQWRLDATSLCATWRWAITHPVTAANATSWPDAYLERKLGACPAGPPEDANYPDLALKLRSNRPNVARANIGELPNWVQDIALMAHACDWTVLRSDHTLAFYTPDGARVETCALGETQKLIEVLRRDSLLKALAALGLPAHRGARGQRAPGRDLGHLLEILAQHAADEERHLRPR